MAKFLPINTQLVASNLYKHFIFEQQTKSLFLREVINCRDEVAHLALLMNTRDANSNSNSKNKDIKLEVKLELANINRVQVYYLSNFINNDYDKMFVFVVLHYRFIAIERLLTAATFHLCITLSHPYSVDKL